MTEVVRRLAITRLGEGVDRSGALLPQAIERVHVVLGGYAREAVELGAERVLAVATSAVRDASNGAVFLEGLATRYGWTTRLLSGAEEAQTTFDGVTSGRSLAAETLLVDIGGGSTELVVGDPNGVSFTTSLQAGSVRLTERFLATDPPTPAELDAAAAQVRSLLPALTVGAAIGVAGTITTVAAIDLGLREYDPVRIHGHRLSRAATDRVLGDLAALPLAARRRVPGLEPERAPVIVGGLVALRRSWPTTRSTRSRSASATFSTARRSPRQLSVERPWREPIAPTTDHRDSWLRSSEVQPAVLGAAGLTRRELRVTRVVRVVHVVMDRVEPGCRARVLALRASYVGSDIAGVSSTKSPFALQAP